ncbi:hypothetical protein DNK56_34400 [Streptomyces sp. AC1-42W]|nr:hypothetical protein DNK56_34400 [Streptomyces sp. AC1-42W]
MLAVSTTRDIAMRALHDGTVGSDDEPIYLVILKGNFTFKVPGTKTVRAGTWAALFVDANSFRVQTMTIRPPEAIPDVSLDSIGTVHILRTGTTDTS